MLKSYETRMVQAIASLEGDYTTDGDGVMALTKAGSNVAKDIASTSMLLTEMLANDHRVRNGNALGGTHSRRS